MSKANAVQSYLRNNNFWLFGLFFFFYFFIMASYYPFFPIWLHDINNLSKQTPVLYSVAFHFLPSPFSQLWGRSLTSLDYAKP